MMEDRTIFENNVILDDDLIVLYETELELRDYRRQKDKIENYMTFEHLNYKYYLKNIVKYNNEYSEVKKQLENAYNKLNNADYKIDEKCINDLLQNIKDLSLNLKVKANLLSYYHKALELCNKNLDKYSEQLMDANSKIMILKNRMDVFNKYREMKEEKIYQKILSFHNGKI